MIAHHAERLAETLEVDNLALPQKPNGSNDIGIIHKAQNVVIGRASLLLWGNHIRINFSEIPVNFDGNIPCSGDSLAD